MVRQQHVSHVFCSTYLFVACLMSNYALLQILNDTLSRIKVRNLVLMFLVHGNISGIIGIIKSMMQCLRIIRNGEGKINIPHVAWNEMKNNSDA